MDKKYGILIICTVILSLCFVGAASAKTWYVDDDGGSDFTTIQDAITEASDSDTIIVRDGTYTENIAVNKRLTLRSENGYATVQAANTSDSVFAVTANYVTISGFTVENSNSSAGISLNGVERCNISYNTVLNNNRGIAASSSNFTIITNNIIADNGGAAICLDNGSSYNRIISNTIIITGAYG
jgi:parallel beta-helix repeat protein